MPALMEPWQTAWKGRRSSKLVFDDDGILVKRSSAHDQSRLKTSLHSGLPWQISGFLIASMQKTRLEKMGYRNSKAASRCLNASDFVKCHSSNEGDVVLDRRVAQGASTDHCVSADEHRLQASDQWIGIDLSPHRWPRSAGSRARAWKTSRADVLRATTIVGRLASPRRTRPRVAPELPHAQAINSSESS